jgi:hypothetical protein
LQREDDHHVSTPGRRAGRHDVRLEQRTRQRDSKTSEANARAYPLRLPGENIDS